MNVIIKTSDAIVLRDGKPFGEHGTHAGGYYDWPMPQTIAGMIRSAIGFSISPDYFKTRGNAEKLLDIAIGPIMAVRHDKKQIQPLYPVPADLLFTDLLGSGGTATAGKLQVHTCRIKPLPTNGGMFTPFAKPLLADWETQEKPSKNVPFRLKQDAFDQYRKGKLKGFFGVDDIGCARPVTQDIQHNAINTDSGKSDDGRLYRTRNLYLSGKGNDSLGIQAVIANIPQGATIPERAYLGGERRTVDLNAVESSMLPAFPKDYAGEKFLKLVLLTPGDFGGWIPEWLRPSLDGSWVSTPSGHAKVRLRHAWLNGWTPVSGWDYLNRRAKPMRKLVPEGAVYLIELEEPSRADAIAEEFWGKPFQQGISAKDGFGYVICTKTGNLIHTEN